MLILYSTIGLVFQVFVENMMRFDKTYTVYPQHGADRAPATLVIWEVAMGNEDFQQHALTRARK